MPVFNGTMRIEGQGGSAVPVNARVAGEQLVLEVEGTEIGAWPVGGLSVEADAGGVVLQLGHELVMIDVTDRTGFVTALRPSLKRRRVRLKRPSPMVTGIGLAGALLVTSAVLAPGLVGALVMLLGLLVSVVGASALSEPRIALRLPLGLTAMHFVVAGTALVGVGVPLVLVG